MKKNFKPKITLFYCTNTFSCENVLPSGKDSNCEINAISLACSSMTKDVFLLRAFESGADAVIVMVCPENSCRYIEGNIRAKKRVEWVKHLLDEIGLDGKRLTIHNFTPNDRASATQVIQNIVTELADLGPNPATVISEKAANI